jgi:hypothetical protein
MADHEEGYVVPDARLLLRECIDSMDYMDREISRVWFGIGDSYALPLAAIAKIFKISEVTCRERIALIENRLEQAELLWIARREVKNR